MWLSKQNTKLNLVWTLVLAVVFSTSAFAHSDLLRSKPSDGEKLNSAPKTIELVFKKELQAVTMNSIAVTDQNGKRVDKSSVAISEDGKQMVSALEELPSGTYTVEWRALSADDHRIKGKFTFTVALPSEGNTASTGVPDQPSQVDSMPMDHQMPKQESGMSWEQSAVRWLIYVAMMTLFGGFAFQLLVLKPTLKHALNLSHAERSLGSRHGEDRFIRLTWLSLVLLSIGALVSLVLQTSTVLEVSLDQALAPSRLFQVLTETSYGPPWFLQIAATLALCVVVFLIARQRKNSTPEQDGLNTPVTLLWIGLGLTALLLLAPSLTGHARAAASEYRFAIVSDWLHLIGVGVWVGGLFHLALTMPKSIGNLQRTDRLSVVTRVIPLFTRLAIAATILIILTGIYNSWIHLDSVSALWTTSYGQVLSLKIILFAPMLALGGLNTFVLGPRANRVMAVEGDKQRALDRSFYSSVRIEAAIGVAVLLLAAILTFLPPARLHEMQMPSMDVNQE